MALSGHTAYSFITHGRVFIFNPVMNAYESYFSPQTWPSGILWRLVLTKAIQWPKTSPSPSTAAGEEWVYTLLWRVIIELLSMLNNSILLSFNNTHISTSLNLRCTMNWVCLKQELICIWGVKTIGICSWFNHKIIRLLDIWFGFASNKCVFRYFHWRLRVRTSIFLKYSVVRYCNILVFSVCKMN